MPIKKYTLLLFLLMAFMPHSVFAAYYNTLKAEIPVSFFADSGEEREYTAIMEPLGSSPSPESDSLLVYGTGTDRFEIPVTEPGTYRYRVYQLMPVIPSGGEIDYDKRVYNVSLFVTVDKSIENGLKYAITAAEQGKEDKPDSISFDNRVRENQGGGGGNESGGGNGGGTDDDTRKTNETGGGTSSDVLNKKEEPKDKPETNDENNNQENDNNTEDTENTDNNGNNDTGTDSRNDNENNTDPTEDDEYGTASRDKTGTGGIQVINNGDDDGSSTDSTGQDTVNTGDSSNQGLWIALMCASLAVMIFSAVMEKRRAV